MKSTLKHLGIAAIIAAIALFSLATCEDTAQQLVTYTVNFDANGGSGTTPDPITAESGKSITLPDDNGLTKNGYTFGGWNTDADGMGTTYDADSSYTVTASLTLYAKWDSVVTYTVTFNANGATSGTAPSAQTANSGSSITLPSGSGLSKSGYTFGGWNANAGGTGTNYAADSSYTVTANITLYAEWIAEGTATYTVTFNANGGNGTAPSAHTASSGSSITIPSGSGLTKTGYTFGGWNTNAEGTGTNYAANSSYTITANTTLYAKWDVAVTTNYTVTFNSNGGSGTAPNAQTVASGSSITIPNDNGLTKTGYTFGGWNTNAEGTGTNYAAGSSYTVTGTITLYARWETAAPTTYTVSFNVNGGSGTPPDAQTVAAGSSITLPGGSGLTRIGFVFVGWNTSASGMGTSYAAGASYTVTGTITLYAKWEDGATTYTVSFDANGGDGTAPGHQIVTVGSSITIPNGNALSRTYYTFGGWNTNASGTGTTYSPGSSYRVTGNVTLYAKWDGITYTVTFSANGGDGTVAAMPAQAGSSITLPNEGGLTRTGYTFVGWNTNASGTGTGYEVGDSYTVIGDTTLYAKWNAIPYTVTFSANGGSGTPPSARSVSYGSVITLPGNSGDGTEANPIMLTANTWADGSITSNTSGRAVWYSFSVTSGTTYRVWWNDGYEGNSTKTLDVIVSAYYSSGTSIFTGVDSGWSSAQSFTANTSGTVKIRVTPYSSSGTGTFAVGYSTSSTRPSGSSGSGGSLSKTGYIFGGWNTNESGTGTNYAADSSYTVTADITLYAKWDAVPNYTVTFNANGATSGTAPSAQTASSGSSITLPGDNGLYKTGYLFGGWNTNESGMGTNYAAGSSYTVTANITLYAKWMSPPDPPEMVFVPGGSFEMGNPDSSIGYSDERPVHTVTLTGFYMGKYEVTQAQWQAVMGTTIQQQNGISSYPGLYGVGDNYPMYHVSWYDALVFCNKLSMAEGLTPAYRINNSTDPSAWGTVPTSSNSTWNAATIDSGSTGYRLPTEAQWEYAAKGGDGSPGNYTYSGSDTVGDVAWYGSNSGSTSHAVGTKNPNGLGIYDMSGNVWEWCWDWYESYSSTAQTDPEGASSGSNRVNRGGDWYYSAGIVRSAPRYFYGPDDRGGYVGFRLVRP